MPATASRPRFLNLLLIRMPAGALTSIGHRLSGVLLFLCIPLAVFLLDLSLQGEDGFEQAVRILGSTGIRVIEVPIAWSLAHHLLAGIRFLLIDLDVGVDKIPARITALLVNGTAPVLALIALWSLW